jgi:hypothetical protein
MVFLVIAITVLLQGLSGGYVARLLGVRRPPASGYALLGGNEVALAIGGLLKKTGLDVVVIDSSPDAVRAAQEEGLRAVFGNALEERTLIRAQLESYEAAVGLTPNEEVNLLFAVKAREEFKVKKAYVALIRKGHVTPEIVHERRALLLFDRRRDLVLWSVRLKRRLVAVERRRVAGKETVLHAEEGTLAGSEHHVLPLIRIRKGAGSVMAEDTRLQKGDEVAFLVFEEQRAAVEEWFERSGWEVSGTVPEEALQGA